MAGKIERPTFFEDPGVDWCWATITALSAEVMALRERLDTVEALAKQKGVLLAGEVDSYKVGEAEAVERKARRDEYTARVFYVLDREFSALE